MPTNEDNCLLVKMSGAEIGTALQGLPDAATYPSDEIQQWATVPSVGGVLVTFRRHRHKHGKGKRVFWVATRAERGA